MLPDLWGPVNHNQVILRLEFNFARFCAESRLRNPRKLVSRRRWCGVESQNLGCDRVRRAGVDPFAGATETGQVRPGVNDPPLTLVALGRPHEKAHGVAHARQHRARRLGLYQCQAAGAHGHGEIHLDPCLVAKKVELAPAPVVLLGLGNNAEKPRLAASATGISRRGVSLRIMDKSKVTP